MAAFAVKFLQGILPLFTLYLVKLLLDAVADGVAAPDDSEALQRVFFYVALSALVSVVAAAIQSVGTLVDETQAEIVADHMAGILHAKSVEVDLAYYENPSYYDTLHRAQQESSFRPTRVARGIGQILRSGISLLAILSLVTAFLPGVAIILVVASVPGLVVRLMFSKNVYRWQRRRTAAQRRVQYIDMVLTGVVLAAEVRLFGLGSFLTSRYRSLRKKLREERLKITGRRALFESVTEALATLAVFGAYAFVGYEAVQGRATVGDFVMIFYAMQRGQNFLGEFRAGLSGLYEDNLFLQSVEEFLRLEPRVKDPVHPVQLTTPLRSGIVMDRVSFQYPTGSAKIIKDASLTVRPGEMIALVGENGSGKTTLVKLLCRLYDPTSGSITIDGQDLRQYELASLRRAISVVFQQFGCYNMKASENIWIGDVDRKFDMHRIESAARQSGAHAMISKLEKTYDTHIGLMFDEGQELSIGGWQKIALARAYFRDAEILVLDEPTSALDPSAEFDVFQQLRRLAKDKISVVISHRFSTVRMADSIYVLEAGVISERGTHEELMRLDGTYARLFDTQAQYYR